MEDLFESTEEIAKKPDTSFEDSLWAEKYRPKEIKDYIGSEKLKKDIKKYIEEGIFPHLLFHSKSSGTGKTSAAKLLCRHIECDLLYINASEENSVETVRTKIKDFARTLGFKKLKVIILDEADFISTEGQAALRNLMETYSKHTRFILTCNYKDKMIPALISRSVIYEVVPPLKSDIAAHIHKILTLENVKYEKNDMMLLVNNYYPDLRKILNVAQQNTEDRIFKFDVKKLVDGDNKLKLLNILKGKEDIKTKFNNIRQLIANIGSSDFIEWYSFLYKNIDEFAEGHIANIISIIAESEYKDAFMVDKEINFCDSMVKILSELNS